MSQNHLTTASSGGMVMDLHAELEEVQRALRDKDQKIEQSQSELAKISQRNANIAAHLRQTQMMIDKVTSTELMTAYDSALDIQQRMLFMRGQLDRLQNDKVHLQKLKTILELTQSSSNQTSIDSASLGMRNTASVEMLVDAQESERQRLSRQMHDGPAQALSNFILQTEIAMRLLDVDPRQTREELNNLKVAAMNTFQKVRNFIFELRPMMLDDLGLAPTLRKYTEAFREQTNLEVNVVVTGTERRMEPYIEVMIFRAIQELIGNASRLSQASSARVFLDIGDQWIKVSVDDNGRGFDIDALDQTSSLGIKLIKERIQMLGGTFELDSVQGKGTRIVFTVPSKPV